MTYTLGHTHLTLSCRLLVFLIAITENTINTSTTMNATHTATITKIVTKEVYTYISEQQENNVNIHT